jgi:purine-nucleoside phosphorylase
MTEQKARILESVNFINQINPFTGTPKLAIVLFENSLLLKEFEIAESIKFKDIPPELSGGAAENSGEFIFGKTKNSKKNVILMNGRHQFYNGYNMRDVSHYIYVMKHLGVKRLILIDEAGHLNPRFNIGGVALVYDHINLMGDNPLIGKNDDSLGPRFPDMSSPYDGKTYVNVEKLLIDRKFKFYPSVYLGVTGPETETEAECRFYREIGADIVGYSIVPENLAAVHCGLNCIAFAMISRELVADRMKEISEEVRIKNRQKAERSFAPILKDLITLLA